MFQPVPLLISFQLFERQRHQPASFLNLLNPGASIQLGLTTSTSSYSIEERLLSVLTLNLTGSVTSKRPHLSTASLMFPLYMSIFAFLMITLVPGFITSTARNIFSQHLETENINKLQLSGKETYFYFYSHNTNKIEKRTRPLPHKMPLILQTTQIVKISFQLLCSTNSRHRKKKRLCKIKSLTSMPMDLCILFRSTQQRHAKYTRVSRSQMY